MDNNQEFCEFVCNSFKLKSSLFMAKNAQYGINDPLANFRTTARCRYPELPEYEGMFKAAKDFMWKHIAHMTNGDTKASKLDESWGDIAVYAIIMEYIVKKANETNEETKR